MFRLKTGELHIYGLHICVGNTLVDIKDVDYTYILQQTLRSLLKGHSTILTRNTLDSLVFGFESIMNNDDKNLMILSNNEKYVAEFNQSFFNDEEQYPIQAWDLAFNAVDCACMFANEKGLDFIHSKEIYIAKTPRLFIFANPNTVNSLGSCVDGFITIQIQSDKITDKDIWNYYNKNEYIEKVVDKNPEAIASEIRYYERVVSI